MLSQVNQQQGIVISTDFLSHQPYRAKPETSLLVLGPSRSGKTSTIMIPNILFASGPVVSTSTKYDILHATLPIRQQLGPCYVFDPLGHPPPGNSTIALKWSPLDAVTDWDSAVAVSKTMVQASFPKISSDQVHWLERAEALLAPVLYAGKLDSQSMNFVVNAILSRDTSPAFAVLENKSQSQLAINVLRGIMATDERELSGIFSTAAGILRAYRSDAALRSTDSCNFDIQKFFEQNSTLYIVGSSRNQDLISPITACLIDEIKSHAYKYYGSGALTAKGGGAGSRAPTLFALDEVAVTAPLPDLRNIVAEGGGQGVLVIAAIQDLLQARARFGPEANGYLTLFPNKLIFPGITDSSTLKTLEMLSGECEIPRTTVTRSGNPNLLNLIFPKICPPSVPRNAVVKNLNYERRPRILGFQIAIGYPRHAFYLGQNELPRFVPEVPYFLNRNYLQLQLKASRQLESIKLLKKQNHFGDREVEVP